MSKKSPVLVVKTDLANQFIDTNTIIYIQATDRDCILHMLNERRQVSRVLKELEGQLLPNFYRIHRSFCVNSDYVAKIGRYVVTLATGETLPVPRMRLQAEKLSVRWKKVQGTLNICALQRKFHDRGY